MSEGWWAFEIVSRGQWHLVISFAYKGEGWHSPCADLTNKWLAYTYTLRDKSLLNVAHYFIIETIISQLADLLCSMNSWNERCCRTELEISFRNSIGPLTTQQEPIHTRIFVQGDSTTRGATACTGLLGPIYWNAKIYPQHGQATGQWNTAIQCTIHSITY